VERRLAHCGTVRIRKGPKRAASPLTRNAALAARVRGLPASVFLRCPLVGSCAVIRRSGEELVATAVARRLGRLEAGCLSLRPVHSRSR